jgi:glycerophosphoryl diester phosphodiesterase
MHLRNIVNNALIVIVLLSSCNKKVGPIGTAKLIAHAGAGLHTSTSPYHDNSIEAINYALSFSDIDGIEVDVQFSADSTAWLFHDDELSIETDGNGCIRSSTDANLSTLHYTGLQQGTLTKLAQLPGVMNGKYLFLDLRNTNACTQELVPVSLAFTILKSFQEALQGNHVSVIVNDASWVESFASLGWSVYLNSYNAQSFLDHPEFSELTGCSLRSEVISKSEISSLQNSGKSVILFDVRSPKGIRKALAKNSNWLFVDDIRAALIEKYP